jgi:hypothetical protein
MPLVGGRSISIIMGVRLALTSTTCKNNRDPVSRHIPKKGGHGEAELAVLSSDQGRVVVSYRLCKLLTSPQ